MNEFNKDSVKILYRKSYWDERVLGFPSIDIVSIESIDESDYFFSIKCFLEYLDNKYRFISFRMSFQDSKLKKVLLNSGFVLVEQSYLVECINPEFKAVLSSKIHIDYLADSIKDIEQVKLIAKEEFHYGRFFEDPYINTEVAQRRNENWISDIIANPNQKILIAKKNNIVIGFMAYQVDEKNIELLLGGVTSNYAHFSYGFWAYIFENYFKNQLIKTTISCSNLGVVNLYKKFGFNFTNHMSGFHLHI